MVLNKINKHLLGLLGQKYTHWPSVITSSYELDENCVYLTLFAPTGVPYCIVTPLSLMLCHTSQVDFSTFSSAVSLSLAIKIKQRFSHKITGPLPTSCMAVLKWFTTHIYFYLCIYTLWFCFVQNKSG